MEKMSYDSGGEFKPAWQSQIADIESISRQSPESLEEEDRAA